MSVKKVEVLVRANWRVTVKQMKKIKQLAKQMKTSESEVVRGLINAIGPVK